MAFASHGVSVSPEAGLSNGGVVVVATTVVVEAMGNARVVSGSEVDDVAQPATDPSTTPNASNRFTY